MPDAKLIIRQPGEPVHKIRITSTDGDISIGRAPDNTISLEGDSDASRYHAVISARRDGFYVSDLGSTNGTTVNRRRITGEIQLQHADVISVGGSTTVEFQFIDDQQTNANVASPTDVVSPARRATPRTRAEAQQDASFHQLGMTQTAPPVAPVTPQVIAPNVPAAASVSSPARSSISPLFIAVAAVLAVGFIAGIGLLIYNLVGTTGGPQPSSRNDIVSLSPTPPILITSTPVIEANTNSSVSPSPAADTPVVNQTNTANADVDALSRNLAAQLSRRSGHIFDSRFLTRIRDLTAQFRGANYHPQAFANRRTINGAFSNTNPLVGHILALSRSRFDPNAPGDGIGLWKIPPAIAQRYLRTEESPETALRDPVRSAEVAAAYFKSLRDTFEEEDFMYAIACFGSPIDEAGQMRVALEQRSPEDRLDFWKMVESGVVSRDKAERVALFFAAGIVGENPRAFGLSHGRLSQLL